jgi:hypothetical protein
MGIHLIKVSQTTIYWLQMVPKHSDRLVLQMMASTALDTTGKKGEPPHLYFGGYDPLILTLGDGLMPEPGTPAYKTQARKVRACLQRLVKAGAIERLEEGRRGHRSVYKLNLDGAWHGT